MTNKVQKKVDARAYNHNQDSFTIENVIRWFDYWRERPGTGDRVSSGGVKSHLLGYEYTLSWCGELSS